jgi:DNA-binding transcriptional ArsR family regulator
MMVSQMHTTEDMTGSDSMGMEPKQEAPMNGEKTPLKIDYLNVKKAALVLRALNHRLRQQMIQVLDAQGKMTVTEIYVQLRLEQSVASQHLAILRRAGIVRTEREGKFVYYRIDPDRVDTINACVDKLTS